GAFTAPLATTSLATASTAIGPLGLVEAQAGGSAAAAQTTQVVLAQGATGRAGLTNDLNTFDTDVNSFTLATGLPSGPYLNGLLGATHPNVSSAMVNGPHSAVYGAAMLGFDNEGFDGVTHTDTATAHFVLDSHIGTTLLVGLIDNQSDSYAFDFGSGGIGEFDSLEFYIKVNGGMVVDELFHSLADAQSYFFDHLLSFDVGNDGNPLDIVFGAMMTSTSTDAGDAFRFDLSFGTVPEPGTWTILILAL